jgi:hypothetical protein
MTMRTRSVLLFAVILLLAACSSGAAQSSPSLEFRTQNPIPVTTPVASADRPPTGSAAPERSATMSVAPESILEARGIGVTLAGGENGPFELQGGRYRIAWHAPGCQQLVVEFVPYGGDERRRIATPLPTGETFVDLPSGPAYLDNSGVGCDWTIRLEAV